MTPEQDKERRRAPRREEADLGPVARMLDALAAEDYETFDELLTANPQLASEYGAFRQAYPEIRAALEGVSLGPEHEAIARQIGQWAKEQAEQAEKYRPSRISDYLRNAASDQVREYFNNMSEAIVMAVLRHMQRSVPLNEVDRIARELCSERVQVRLRTAERIREELVQVFAEELRDPRVCDQLSGECLGDIMLRQGKHSTLVDFEQLTIQGVC